MTKNSMAVVKWQYYIAAFFAGMFLANAVPHYVQGISGHAFPSPFGHPPGFGKSSAISNVLWGALNLLIGYLLFRISRIEASKQMLLLAFYRGIITQGVMLSLAFAGKS